MPRYALKIEYNGAPYCGWQRQKSLPTVQQAVETALRKLDPEVGTIFAAGRTDTGVHATAQVAHVDMIRDWSSFRLGEALNYHLKPAPIAVVQVAEVSEDFHARFSALERRYSYRLICRRAPLVHDKGLAWRISHALDLSAMQEAAKHLLGRHDFTTFRSVHCQAESPIKTLSQLDISEHALEHGVEYRFTIRARSFLHNQVRGFVGSLERVGAGSWQAGDMKVALEARDRNACGPVCVPYGLYLAGVGYDVDPFAG